jgi:hypothetical protein
MSLRHLRAADELLVELARSQINAYVPQAFHFAWPRQSDQNIALHPPLHRGEEKRLAPTTALTLGISGGPPVSRTRHQRIMSPLL